MIRRCTCSVLNDKCSQAKAIKSSISSPDQSANKSLAFFPSIAKGILLSINSLFIVCSIFATQGALLLFERNSKGPINKPIEPPIKLLATLMGACATSHAYLDQLDQNNLDTLAHDLRCTHSYRCSIHHLLNRVVAT